jgi:hypothetical protein
MAHISVRRLGLVILATILLTSLFAWRLQAGGHTMTMFDFSSPPIAPSQVFLPLILRSSAQPLPPYRNYLPLVVRSYPAAPPQHKISPPLVVR